MRKSECGGEASNMLALLPTTKLEGGWETFPVASEPEMGSLEEVVHRQKHLSLSKVKGEN